MFTRSRSVQSWLIALLATSLFQIPLAATFADERKAKATFEGHTEGVGPVAFSPDGKLLVSYSALTERRLPRQGRTAW
jgi:WD40 repeat protein